MGAPGSREIRLGIERPLRTTAAVVELTFLTASRLRSRWGDRSSSCSSWFSPLRFVDAKNLLSEPDFLPTAAFIPLIIVIVCEKRAGGTKKGGNNFFAMRDPAYFSFFFGL